MARLFAVLAGLWLITTTAFAQIYVAPDGDDRARGTIAAPVATLTRAVALAALAHPAGDGQRIILRGGTHRLAATLALGLEASPASGQRLRFEAYPGEQPVISGGQPIRGWRRLDPAETPAELPATARGHVWVADVPATGNAAWRFHALYDGFTPLPRARSPQYISRHAHTGLFERLRDRDVLEYPAGTIRNWPNLADVEILARPNHDWLVNYLGIESIDAAAGVAHTTVPATYTLSGRFWVENVLEALDEPGEWVLNTTQHRLYLWPRGDAPGDNIVAPRLTTLIRVAGREDSQANGDQPAGGFAFVGLTFAHTDRDVWAPTDEGLQHDWAMWDKDDACLRFRVARDCEVKDCTFVAAGGNGIRADLFAQGLRITGNTFHHLGAGGVLCAGYGPGTKDVNRGNEIVDNEFAALGELTWHSPAVFLWQSGHNRVAHNYIHDLPYNAIVLSGVRPRYFGIATPKIPEPTFPPDLREDVRTMRWREIGRPCSIEGILPFAHTRENVVEENEICDVMKILKDGNGIYLSAAGKGNILRGNVIYGMNGSAAIRTDDDQSYVSITKNVTVGGGIVIKDFNFTWNNLLINGDLVIVSDRPDSRVDHNVFVCSITPPRFYRYDVVNSYFGNQPNDATLANFNPRNKPVVPPRTDHNLFFCPDRPATEAFIAEMRHRWSSDQESAIGDPRLRDPAHGDFRFAPGSPTEELGIENIDTTHAGRLAEPMVHRLLHSGEIDLRSASFNSSHG